MSAATVTALTASYTEVGTAGTTTLIQAIYSGGGLGWNSAGEQFYAEVLVAPAVDEGPPEVEAPSAVTDRGLMLKTGETLTGTALAALGAAGSIYARSNGPVQLRAF
jgi:hypothetical protein